MVNLNIIGLFTCFYEINTMVLTLRVSIYTIYIIYNLLYTLIIDIYITLGIQNKY